MISREWIEDYLGALGFHTCTGPGAAYFEFGWSQYLHDPSPRRFTYDVVGVGGVKPEGASTGLVATSDSRAFVEFIYELGKYVLAHGRRGDTVVWRRMPATDARHYENEFHGEFDSYYTANCRLVVVPGRVTSDELRRAFNEMVERNEREESKENTKDTKKLGDRSEAGGVHAGRPDSGQSE